MVSAVPSPLAATPPIASQWISANAGSGKTTVLTRQVVKLLLLGVPPERICCITYTKAAAGEMRARVLKSLRELMLADDEACLQRVGELLGARATPEQLKRARQLFGTVLDSPAGGVQLTTIHGFCQQVLRAFPIEAGVAPHFTVLDDMQEAQLQHQVKHRLLASERVEPELAAAITLLAERSGEARFDTLVKALLALELPNSPSERLRAQLYHQLAVEEGASEETLAAALLHCLSDAQKDCLRAALPRLQGEGAAYKRDLASGVERWLRGEITVEDWLQIFLTQKLTPRTNLQKGEFAPGSPLGNCVAYCINVAERFVAQRAALALAEESAAALVLAKKLQALYEEAKAERGVLDYDDLITRTRELLTLRDMVGWVMSKLDHRIDHLLIDEAQDTSAEQWGIAHALVDELVASNNGEGSAGVPRSLFVVGDEKQSIFSFQGAAPELYATQHGKLAALLEHTATPLRLRELKHSYRSAPAILRVVDAVAAQPEVAAALSSGGQPQQHEAVHVNKVGRVVLHAPIPYVEKEKAEEWVIPQEYSITRSTAQMLAETVAEQVAAWIDAGEWNAGDILILTRNRKPIVQPLLRALQRRKVAVAGIDRLVLSAHLAVKDLLALARWCASTHDDLALAQVLRSPLMEWSDAQLYEAAHDRGRLPLWLRVRENAEAAATLERWRAASEGGAYEFLTAVLEADAARTRFVARFGAEVHEVLDELKAQAMQMPAGMAPTTANFAAWIAGSERQIKREMDAGGHDQVRVMTVHGSKGLEAPCVLMVDTVGMPRTDRELFRTTQSGGIELPLLALSDIAKLAPAWKNGDDALKHSQRAEYYRLLYVAMTRASEALHVFAAESGKGELKPDCWYKIIERSLKELPGSQQDDEMIELKDSGLKEAKTRAEQREISTALPLWVNESPPKPVLRSTLSPSGLGREELKPFRKQRGEGARERGVRLHRVLQFLDANTSRAQLEALVNHLAPDWSAAERATAISEVWALYERERWLWQHPAQAEANITGTIRIGAATFPVSGQIDRLVVTPDAVVVLDYKTGRSVPPSAAGVSEGYLLQLKLYCTLLETLYPGKRVRPAIVWTANAQLMWLDEAVSAIDWNRAALPQMA